MGAGREACIRSTSSPRPGLESSAVLSSNISSYFSTANDIFCASRGFMLRPPITKPTHKRQLHPNLLSTVSRVSFRLVQMSLTSRGVLQR